VDPYLRGLAALRAPGPSTSASMSAAVRSEREGWRIAPLALAAVRLGDDSALPALVSSLSAGELSLEVGFLAEVVQAADATLVPALASAQERVEEELVLPVAAARVELGDLGAEQTLRKALADEDVERRLEALDYVVTLPDASALPLLRRAVEVGPELVTAYADLALAARTGADPDTFGRAYASADREVRALAVRFAGEAAARGSARRERAAIAVVLDAMDDDALAVRVEACRAAGELRLAAAAPQAARLLRDEAELVRVEASGALLSLTEG
jgi:HEAT repeat protein